MAYIVAAYIVIAYIVMADKGSHRPASEGPRAGVSDPRAHQAPGTVHRRRPFFPDELGLTQAPRTVAARAEAAASGQRRQQARARARRTQREGTI